jgi:elongation factor 2
VAVEPNNPADLSFLPEALEKLAIEDPNLITMVNKETGEYLLSGMGELHLEVALKRLKEYASGAEIAVSPPRVVYREAATVEGVVAVARSPNKRNKFAVRAKPLDRLLAGVVEQDAGAKTFSGVLAVDEYQNVLVDCTGRGEAFRSVLDYVVSGFVFACKAGPLGGEPLRRVQVDLVDVQLGEHAEDRAAVEVMRGVGKAVFGSFLTADPVLLEPVYKMVISVPVELAGDCARIVGGRRGEISGFEQKGALTIVTGYVPVAETFGLAEELRSATSGRAFWQSMLDHWERVPEKLTVKTVGELRRRKGLPFAVPEQGRFMEETR